MIRVPRSRRATLLSGLVAAAVLASCGGGAGSQQAGKPANTVIQNKGSDTMVNVAQVWAEEYRKVAPDVEVEVSGGGSGVGIAALLKGAVDIANASRDIKPAEIEQAAKNTGKQPVGFTVGFDALAVYVHKDNPLDGDHAGAAGRTSTPRGARRRVGRSSGSRSPGSRTTRSCA